MGGMGIKFTCAIIIIAGVCDVSFVSAIDQMLRAELLQNTTVDFLRDLPLIVNPARVKHTPDDQCHFKAEDIEKNIQILDFSSNAKYNPSSLI